VQPRASSGAFLLKLPVTGDYAYSVCLLAWPFPTGRLWVRWTRYLCVTILNVPFWLTIALCLPLQHLPTSVEVLANGVGISIHRRASRSRRRRRLTHSPASSAPC